MTKFYKNSETWLNDVIQTGRGKIPNITNVDQYTQPTLNNFLQKSKATKTAFSPIIRTQSVIYSGTIAYKGGVLGADGNIHLIPYGSGGSANRGQLIRPDGTSSTYSLVYTTNTAYDGGVLAPNGDIHFVPVSAVVGQKISSIGAVSTYSLARTSGTYKGGVLAPNGDIHFIPTSAPVGQKVSTITGAASTYSLVYTTSLAYNGGVLDTNGEIHFIPYNAAVGQKITLTGNVSTYSLPVTGQQYGGGFLDYDGNIIFTPLSTILSAPFANIMRITKNGIITTHNISIRSGGTLSSSCVLPDGSYLIAARSSYESYIIDPANMPVGAGAPGSVILPSYGFTLPSFASGDNSYQSVILNARGEVVYLPYGQGVYAVVSIFPQIEQPSLYKSTFYNNSKSGI